MHLPNTSTENNLREGVFYVTPSGIAFSKENVIELAKKLQKIFESIAEVARNVIDWLVDAWKGVKNFINQHIEFESSLPPARLPGNTRKGWMVPKDTTMPSQVMGRKPSRSTIRRHL